MWFRQVHESDCWELNKEHVGERWGKRTAQQPGVSSLLWESGLWRIGRAGGTGALCRPPARNMGSPRGSFQPFRVYGSSALHLPSPLCLAVPVPRLRPSSAAIPCPRRIITVLRAACLLNVWRIFTCWNQSTREGSGTSLIRESFVLASQHEHCIGFRSEMGVEKLGFPPADKFWLSFLKFR